MTLSAVAKEIAQQRGEFSLFAAMHRPDTSDRWEAVVAAPWLDPEGMKDYRYLAVKLQGFFAWNQGPRLSHASILKLNNPIVRALLASRDPEAGQVYLMTEPAGPVEFDKGFLIARKPLKLVSGERPKGLAPRVKMTSAGTSGGKKRSQAAGGTR
jgi:hypothetical protein